MKVAVLGCGYLGLELGRQLIVSGHDVVGVRRSESGLAAMEAAGIRGLQGDVTDPDTLERVPDVDTVVFAASSGGRDAAAARRVYVAGQQIVLEHFAAREQPPDRYVYTSSTGVYGDQDGAWVDEETPRSPDTPKTEALAAAEDVVFDATESTAIDPTIARIAGIYGPDRYRIEPYLAGPVVAGYRNVVHRDDAAGAITFLLETDRARGEVVLVVDDEPVSRWDFADWLAAQSDRDPPSKQTVEQRLAADSDSLSRRLRADKRCSNERLRAMGYEFEYPTFREGYRAEIADFCGARDR